MPHFLAYIITNTVTGKRYAGITSCKKESLEPRWKRHLSELKKPRVILHKAMKKYGVDNFSIEHVASSLTWEDLCAVETSLILQYDTFFVNGRGYNMTLGGEGTFGHVLSDEARAKIGNSGRGRVPSDATRKLLGDSNRGKKRSPEVGKKISKALTGRKLSAETIAKRTASRAGWRPTPESVEKRTAPTRGRKQSPEWVAKRTEGVRKAHKDGRYPNDKTGVWKKLKHL